MFWLTPPATATVIISVVLAILALLVQYAHAALPLVAGHGLETLLIAYLVLLVVQPVPRHLKVLGGPATQRTTGRGRHRRRRDMRPDSHDTTCMALS
jgi:hypothetical protein